MPFIRILIFLLCISCFIETGGAEEYRRIVFMADTQRPLWIEAITRRKEYNEEATQRLFSSLVSAPPRAFFLLGDITEAGSKNEVWNPVDSLLGDLRASGTTIHATPGNHEYMFSRQKAKENYTLRFGTPKLIEGVIVDSIGVILLNSNLSALSDEERTKQPREYELLLDQYERSESIKRIIVCTHHSPYTNSSVVGPSEYVQQTFVGLFEKSQKSVLWLSGHSHNAELFARNGKYYMVIGGGGGLRQPLRKNPRFDDCMPTHAKRRFFYLSVEREGERLKLSGVGMNQANESPTLFPIITL